MLATPHTEDGAPPPAEAASAVASSVAGAVEEIGADVLRERWLSIGDPAPVVTYVAALQPAGRRGRRSDARQPGSAGSPAPTPHRPAAPVPRRMVKRTVALLRACVRRGGGQHWLLLLAAPAMLVLVLAIGFVGGSRHSSSTQTAAPPAQVATIPQPAAAAAAATVQPRSSPISAAVTPTASTSTAAAIPPARVAVRLSCNADPGPLNFELSLATVEVIAVGANRCAGWLLVQAETAVSWVPRESIPDATDPPGTAGIAP